MRTMGKHSTLNIQHSTSKADGRIANPSALKVECWMLNVPHARPSRRAFSLLEVMIAIAIFFTCSFAILALVSSGLRTARMLKNTRPNASMLAVEIVSTNLTDGASGDFGRMYPDYNWTTSDPIEVDTNGLWQVDIAITRRGQREPESTLSIWKFDPNYKSKGLGVR